MSSYESEQISDAARERDRAARLSAALELRHATAAYLDDDDDENARALVAAATAWLDVMRSS